LVPSFNGPTSIYERINEEKIEAENKIGNIFKGKGHPRTVHEGPEWEYRYSSTLS
jgi:hypothetical protein